LLSWLEDVDVGDDELVAAGAAVDPVDDTVVGLDVDCVVVVASMFLTAAKKFRLAGITADSVVKALDCVAVVGVYQATWPTDNVDIQSASHQCE
jgi:hypothetical protein